MLLGWWLDKLKGRLTQPSLAVAWAELGNKLVLELSLLNTVLTIVPLILCMYLFLQVIHTDRV